MQKTLKGLMAMAAFMALAGAGIANAQSSTRPEPSVGQSPLAQQQPPAQNPSAPRETTLSGELLRVNPDTKMFTVKNTAGETQFKYSDQTIVSGAQKTVAGLATMSGEQVTVSYRIESGTNMATKIEVKEKK